ncbi:hypothetical protein [Actinopolymorpha rutila]|uniref:Uncharacterized protein n=1 Tax=Actinopolymorpha rutila TaxID=446787 RepID=A0A852ZM82_9ACTN|nr:hypothetical protein [Actinopolymorpha rutila]NYH93235.1 hypothetical protein [Actinopolymorpha rutila]
MAVTDLAPAAKSRSATAEPLTRQLRWLEDVLDTLAAWEDADDFLTLPAPLAGQQTLHAVRRVQDGLVAGGPVHQADVRLLRRALHVLRDGVANGDADLGEALRVHAPLGRSPVHPLAALLDDLTHDRPEYADEAA